VTGYTVGSLRSMGSKKFTPGAFALLPVKVGLRSPYVRTDVMATPKVQRFANSADGFIATPKDCHPRRLSA
jgi:ribonuclease R